jgi:hypothetical protein
MCGGAGWDPEVESIRADLREGLGVEEVASGIREGLVKRSGTERRPSKDAGLLREVLAYPDEIRIRHEGLAKERADV